MNDALLALAEETQKRHAALIEEASRRTSTEARLEVRNDLESLRSSFTLAAMSLTGVLYPTLWNPAVPDHAVAIAVRADIADTADRLARLANNEAFQKLIKSDFGYAVVNLGGKDGKNTAIALGGIGVALIVLLVIVALK